MSRSRMPAPAAGVISSIPPLRVDPLQLEFGDHAHRPGAPPDGQCRQPCGLPVVREGVEECVGGGVIALPGRGDDRPRRPEHDEEFQIVTVETPCAAREYR